MDKVPAVVEGRQKITHKLGRIRTPGKIGAALLQRVVGQASQERRHLRNDLEEIREGTMQQKDRRMQESAQQRA